MGAAGSGVVVDEGGGGGGGGIGENDDDETEVDDSIKAGLGCGDCGDNGPKSVNDDDDEDEDDVVEDGDEEEKGDDMEGNGSWTIPRTKLVDMARNEDEVDGTVDEVEVDPDDNASVVVVGTFKDRLPTEEEEDEEEEEEEEDSSDNEEGLVAEPVVTVFGDRLLNISRCFVRIDTSA